MKPIIKVEAISKQYRIGKHRRPYSTLREALMEAITSPLKQRRRRQSKTGTVWALRDVSFEIQPGEVVGIIGRNGAGKSTLLKMLSRITEPSAGRIQLYGRIGSLLEVGTGFHPELTGRENVFLNGAILGMRRAEIERKFDAIVAFSEIEEFVDTPVKWYSTGMYLRLAFSVAAHLEPEILVLDEVLAVGDTRFQRKCLNKMQEITREGRTILFVSHDMHAIARVCQRVMLLSDGRITQDGPAARAISTYLGVGADSTAEREWKDSNQAPGDDKVRLRAVRVGTEDARVADLIDIRKPIFIEIEYDVLKPGESFSAGILCNNEEDVCVFSSADLSPQHLNSQGTDFTGRRIDTCTIPGNLLTEGMFGITIEIYGVLNGIRSHVNLPNIIGFRVFDALEGDTARGIYTGPYAGVVRPFLSWNSTSVATINEKDTSVS